MWCGWSCSLMHCKYWNNWTGTPIWITNDIERVVCAHKEKGSAISSFFFFSIKKLYFYLFIICVAITFELYDQAAKDDIGTIRIQRPHKGPFYVSPKTIDQLIANLGKWARLLYSCIDVYLMFWCVSFWIDSNALVRWYKYASVGLTLFGAYLMAKHAIQYILERRRRGELQKRYTSPLDPSH